MISLCAHWIDQQIGQNEQIDEPSPAGQNQIHLCAKQFSIIQYEFFFLLKTKTEHTIQGKSAVRVNWSKTFVDFIFLIQVSLGNEKSFGKWAKAWYDSKDFYLIQIIWTVGEFQVFLILTII